jgi:hypothetical protein
LSQVTVRCSLSRRQAALYAELRKQLSIQDLMAIGAGAGMQSATGGAAGGGAAGGAATSRLIGIIMQMRKVCVIEF